jgi:hypothetical protein
VKRGICFFALLAAAACRGEKPNKIGDGPYADKLGEDIPKIENATGLKFKTTPKIEVRTRDQVREFLLQRVVDTAYKKQIANQEALFRTLGLIPDTLKLGDLLVKVLTEQIMGFYDPKTKVLYVVKDAPEEYLGITIMHELIHALQDQYVNLDSLQHVTGNDHSTVIQAVIEGQATFQQMWIMAGGGSNIAQRFPGGWDSMRQTIREGLKSQPVFSSMPRALQESMLFPYINGADFARRFQGARGKLNPLDSIPLTTEQMMHSERFFEKRDAPSEITLPAIPGTFDTDDLGEFGARIFMYSHLRAEEISIRASNGWDGDKYALVHTPGGDAIVWVTVWDERQDGIEFIDAMNQVIRQRFNRVPRITGERRYYEADKRKIVIDVREVEGRPVVLYVDVPASQSTDLIDFSKVKVVPK